MPPIFSEEEREEIQKNLIITGFEMIKEKGIRKTSIDEVAKAVGIAKGTFYHFFESKQIFIMEIINDYRNRKLDEFRDTVSHMGIMGVDDLLAWYRTMLDMENNPLLFITPQDDEWLRENLPLEFIYNEQGDLEMAKMLLSKVKGVRNDIDYAVLANIPKIIFLAVEHKEELHKASLEQNIELMLKMLKLYITGGI